MESNIENNPSSSSVKSNHSIIIILGFFALALMATNPSIEDHRQAVLEKMKEKISTESTNSSQWEKVGENIGMAIGQRIIESAVSRKNYILFSVTKISNMEETKNIGLGIFGNVWIVDISNMKM